MNKDKQINNGVMDFQFNINDELIFDVGLNSGAKSAGFLAAGARVVGFEPQKECCSKAAARLSDYEYFIAENIALDSKEGESLFYKSNYHTLSSMSKEFTKKVNKNRWSGVEWSLSPESIKVSTLDLMIAKYGKPKYIKIDVEGYEYQVLQGLTQPVDYISIEYTPELYQESERCLRYLDELNNGNCKYNYVYRENDHYQFANWINIDEIISYISSVNDYVHEFGDIYINMEKCD